jgi:hypothetical protein
MRIATALLVLLCLSTGAKAEKTEPFGVPFYAYSDGWAHNLQIWFTANDNKKIISDIAEKVRQKPKETWVTWTNQLVNLSVEVYSSSKNDVCARKAVAKYEVLRQLGLPKEDLRLVYGVTSAEEHAVAAVYSREGWLILDNGNVTSGFKPPLDSQVRGFQAKRSFN